MGECCSIAAHLLLIKISQNVNYSMRCIKSSTHISRYRNISDFCVTFFVRELKQSNSFHGSLGATFSSKYMSDCQSHDAAGETSCALPDYKANEFIALSEK